MITGKLSEDATLAHPEPGWPREDAKAPRAHGQGRVVSLGRRYCRQPDTRAKPVLVINAATCGLLDGTAGVVLVWYGCGIWRAERDVIPSVCLFDI